MHYVIQTKGLVKKFLSKSYTKWAPSGHVGDFIQELLSRRVKREWKTAVDGVDIAVEEGEFVGLFGPNGSGKTTLLKVLSGFTYPTEGEAYVMGYSVLKDREKVLQLVNYVPGLLTGGAWIHPDFTARRNLQLVVEMFNLPKDKVKEALEVMGLTEAADKRVGTFSSGMAARLLLAFSLLRDAPVLLLDEPTVGVSPEAAKELLDHIAHLNQKGCTVVYATHHIPEIQKLCTKVFIMDKGKVIVEGTPKQLIKSLGRKEVIELSLLGYTSDVENHLKQLPEVGTIVSTSEDNPHRSSIVRLHVDSSRETLPFLIQLLVKKHDCQIRNIQIIEPNLEDVYMHYAGRRVE